MSALPSLLPYDALDEARWRVVDTTTRLAHARAVRAEALRAAEQAEAEHEEALVAWGRLRDGLTGRAP